MDRLVCCFGVCVGGGVTHACTETHRHLPQDQLAVDARGNKLSAVALSAFEQPDLYRSGDG